MNSRIHRQEQETSLVLLGPHLPSQVVVVQTVALLEERSLNANSNNRLQWLATVFSQVLSSLEYCRRSYSTL